MKQDIRISERTSLTKKKKRKAKPRVTIVGYNGKRRKKKRKQKKKSTIGIKGQIIPNNRCRTREKLNCPLVGEDKIEITNAIEHSSRDCLGPI